MTNCVHDLHPSHCPYCLRPDERDEGRWTGPIQVRMRSNYDGNCLRCGERFFIGDPVAKLSGWWLHAGCAEEAIS